MAVGIVHISALGVGQLKLHISQRSLGDLVQLADDDGPGAFVDKAEGLPLAGLDLDALGGGVQQDALGDLDLLGGDGSSRLQIGYDDAPILAGDVLAVIGSDNRTCRVCNQESHALQRLIASF